MYEGPERARAGCGGRWEESRVDARGRGRAFAAEGAGGQDQGPQGSPRGAEDSAGGSSEGFK